MSAANPVVVELAAILGEAIARALLVGTEELQQMKASNLDRSQYGVVNCDSGDSVICSTAEGGNSEDLAVGASGGNFKLGPDLLGSRE